MKYSYQMIKLSVFYIILGMNIIGCSKNGAREDSIQGPDIERPSDVGNKPNGIPFSNMLGVNGFDWEYTNNTNAFDDRKFELIKTFTGFRQYLDWDRIEEKEGFYRFSYDEIYKKNQENGITTLACLQIIPQWFREKYYAGEYNVSDRYNSLRDYTPVPKGADKSNPRSYIDMGKLGFQMAARYGNNPSIDPKLIKAVTWGDARDTKIGLGTLKYIECSNEPDKDWRGPEAQQTPEEYAAQLSAFYDGHMGTLGEGVGVKTADPSMNVVMAGIAFPDPKWVEKMIEWCKKNRVKDGQYTLCFDVINYHEYSAKRSGEYWNNPDLNANHGMAPELSNVGKVATNFRKVSEEKAGGLEVWVTECGFDVNERSIQRALPIKNKTTFDSQADWTLRTSLLYARKGIDRVFFYMLNDVNINSDIQYASSGLIEGNERRPSADFLLQAKNLIGEYVYSGTINDDPLVDIYTLGQNKIYVLTVPDQKGREEKYTLDLPGIKGVKIHTPRKGHDSMLSADQALANGKLEVLVTETPTFVEVLN
ncbi:hypothetical protein GCM10007415_37260 [Parapedobacter pyrenivorans]|uniref:Glycoside hydrolase family 42 N-terminal domain-containing protein n=2 Tax=Parapedobacter pyrenivorans TaxID=1305674 RepID=A0A917HZS5_9SPHI|nr:hypothetical protein GCM10007415_37260 [Parapedobacter pyrenivorans]